MESTDINFIFQKSNLSKDLMERKFGDKKIHIEIVTNGDFLKPKLVSDLYSSGLKQLVISMYDGPEQIEYFNSLEGG